MKKLLLGLLIAGVVTAGAVAVVNVLTAQKNVAEDNGKTKVEQKKRSG